MNNISCKDFFKNKKVLITGGLGFIGSNLAIRLVEQGATVTLLDGIIEGHGGNEFNIDPIKGEAEVEFGDIRDAVLMNKIVKDKDFIFHLAGQNDHVLSIRDPFPDIDINIKGSAVLLEACKNFNKTAKLIYTGTRGEYGTAASLPVKETAAINPKGIYELSSLTVQKLFKIYHENHGVKSITLRLTNIYGERAQMRHNRFGVANWFVRLAVEGKTIKVFGDGSILRDFLYVEDTVRALLTCAMCEEAYGEVFNVGHNKPSTFLELAKNIVKIAGKGDWEMVPFTKERLIQEPGDFYSDITKIKNIVGWEPKVFLEEGIGRTVRYYEEHKQYYW
ncbi:MAG: GDP-mannose 4,6-dehydratase [Candidatus Omnitrophica bacterium]|nr:GDP-mannose 4,6-dehydratase [Candidatus Omnitrophota bacterium]MBU1894898.1 GDP-mannose 4,6-dehydratase [Candidatus Omnitrophota bacterium]